MSRRRRLFFALLIGVTSAVFSYVLLVQRGFGAGDFTWPLGGVEALLHGINPYHNPAFGFAKPYPHSSPLYYPLPALFVALPFTLVPPYLAGALFYGIGSGLLAYAITRDGLYRLPVFLSAPFYVGAFAAQWVPLVTAAALLPWLLPIAFAKPNLGLAIGVAYPNLRAFIATVLIFGSSLIIMPSWPLDWFANLSGTRHFPPVLIFPGVVLLVAAVAWRRHAGRLLLMMAIAPQLLFFYDQLPLWLIPRTWRQSLLLTSTSWVAWEGWIRTQSMIPGTGSHVAQAAVWIVVGIYFPALVLVLWQVRPSMSVATVPSSAFSAHVPQRIVAQSADIMQRIGLTRKQPSRVSTREATPK
jgi:hypothetical protein